MKGKKKLKIIGLAQRVTYPMVIEEENEVLLMRTGTTTIKAMMEG